MYDYIFDQIDIESCHIVSKIVSKNYPKGTQTANEKGRQWQKRIIFEQNCDGLTRNLNHNQKIHFPFFDWFLHRFHSTFCTIFSYGILFLFAPLFRSPQSYDAFAGLFFHIWVANTLRETIELSTIEFWGERKTYYWLQNIESIHLYQHTIFISFPFLSFPSFATSEILKLFSSVYFPLC